MAKKKKDAINARILGLAKLKSAWMPTGEMAKALKLDIRKVRRPARVLAAGKKLKKADVDGQNFFCLPGCKAAPPKAAEKPAKPAKAKKAKAAKKVKTKKVTTVKKVKSKKGGDVKITKTVPAADAPKGKKKRVRKGKKSSGTTATQSPATPAAAASPKPPVHIPTDEEALKAAGNATNEGDKQQSTTAPVNLLG